MSPFKLSEIIWTFSLCYTLHTCDFLKFYFLITGHMYLLFPFTVFTHLHYTPPLCSHQFVLRIYEFSVLFYFCLHVFSSSLPCKMTSPSPWPGYFPCILWKGNTVLLRWAWLTHVASWPVDGEQTYAKCLMGALRSTMRREWIAEATPSRALRCEGTQSRDRASGWVTAHCQLRD